jgi:murein DD-endopeptidase MepM/ murein hydrolase activator NlpD
MLFAAGGGYLLFGIGSGGSLQRTENATIIATADVASEGQPVVPFAAVDPAIIDLLLNANPVNDPGQTVLLPGGVPSIGIYLPRRGPEGLQFDLRPDPALEPPADGLIPQDGDGLPINSDAAGDVELLEYAGEGCAPSGLPVPGLLTQRYHRFHTGIDVGVPLGSPVVATHSGDVIFAGWSAYGYGFVVIVENGPFITYYAHLTNFNVTADTQIGAGSIIGWSGSTGNSTGPHVHYETRINDVPVDPLTFEQRGYASC